MREYWLGLPIAFLCTSLLPTLGSKNTELMNKLKWVMKEIMMFIMFTVIIFACFLQSGTLKNYMIVTLS